MVDINMTDQEKSEWVIRRVFGKPKNKMRPYLSVEIDPDLPRGKVEEIIDKILEIKGVEFVGENT